MADSYPSIFGTSAPKFIYDLGGVNEEEVLLDRVRILRDEPDLDDIEHKSVITGHTEWTNKGKHWTFEVQVQIFDEDNYTNAYNLYLSLKSFKHKLVTLWKRRDGTQIQNDNDEDVLFFIERVEENYLEHYLFPDFLIMTFVSQNPVDLPLTTIPPPVYETPVTVLELYGENWNGTVMSGHTPPISFAEVGSVGAAAPSGLNSKKAMDANVINEYLYFTEEINAGADNYVVFVVGAQPGQATAAASSAFDGRLTAGTYPRMLIRVGASSGNISDIEYYWGTDAFHQEVVNLPAYDNRNFFIRCFIFRNTYSKLYVEGGSAVHAGGWTPTALGGASYFNRVCQNSSNFQHTYIAHLSIHKFPVSSNPLDLDWVNNYGAALATYYAKIWNNITVQP